MEVELRAKTVEAVKALKELSTSGTIDKPTLYKGLVALAYEFAVGNEPGLVTKLLLEVPLSYYQEGGDQLRQILDDPQFAEVCQGLARLLIVYGMVDIGPIITQSPGVA